MSQEQSLWKTHPSQWLNFGHFFLAFLMAGGAIAGGCFFPPTFAALIIPAIYALLRFIKLRSNCFELTNERLRITSGVLNQRLDEIELYRVKDSLLIRSWWMRPLGLASIQLTTSDRNQPSVAIPAISNGLEYREILRQEVEAIRAKQRVREVDLTDSELSHDALA